ncbi:MAG: reprolysin-like metallopeptidase, partial [Primorskyibacter sp.]
MTIVTDYTALLATSESPYFVWNGFTDLATPVILTYSFADGENVPSVADLENEATDTSAFTAAQRENFRAATDIFHATAGLIFVEVEEGGMIDVANAHGSEWAGWAFYPNSSEYWTDASLLIIDDTGDYDPGSFAFDTILHELGHALGLQHPFEGALILDDALDNTSNTIMSYNTADPRETLAHMDIDALVHLYGAVVDTSGWVLNFVEETQILTVTGDDAGNTIAGAMGENHLDGGAGDDLLLGRQGDDTFVGGAGDDTILGGLGDDTVVLSGAQGAYSFGFVGTGDDMAFQITDLGTGDVDTLDGIETLQFAGQATAFDAVFALVDLSFAAAVPSVAALTTGVTTGVSINVQNVDGNSSAEDVLVRAYLSTDATLDDADVEIGSLTFDLIQVGWSVSSTLALNAPDTLAEGDYRLIYAIGPVEDAEERDPSDDQAVASDLTTVSAPPPDNFLVAGTPGDDDLVGQAGNDTLIGGLGDDDHTGGAGTDQAEIADTLRTGDALNVGIAVHADHLVITSADGADTIR